MPTSFSSFQTQFHNWWASVGRLRRASTRSTSLWDPRGRWNVAQSWKFIVITSVDDHTIRGDSTNAAWLNTVATCTRLLHEMSTQPEFWNGSNVNSATSRRWSSKVPLSRLLLSLPGAWFREDHSLLLLLGQDGSIRSREVVGWKARRNFSPPRFSTRRLFVLRFIPQIRSITSRQNRAMESQVQLRLAWSFGVYSNDSDRLGWTLQRPNLGNVLWADADVAASQKLRVFTTTALPCGYRESHDLRWHQRLVSAPESKKLSERISLQAESPCSTISRRHDELAVVFLVSGEIKLAHHQIDINHNVVFFLSRFRW